jgi:hypothetical protein
VHVLELLLALLGAPVVAQPGKLPAWTKNMRPNTAAPVSSFSRSRLNHHESSRGDDFVVCVCAEEYLSWK